jgi:methyltransferase-like protein
MYKALVTFSGLVSAYKRQTINIENQEIAKDLLEAGYIESVDNKPKKETTKKVKEKTPE